MDHSFPELPANAFAKADTSPDTRFLYSSAFGDAYRRRRHRRGHGALSPICCRRGGVVLDLMSSWVSHLPDDIAYAEVIGHGMNAHELAANPRLNRWFTQDLNADPALPLPPASVDAACMCVSIQYVQRPAEVFESLANVLRPGAPVVIQLLETAVFPTKGGGDLAGAGRPGTNAAWSNSICSAPGSSRSRAVRCGTAAAATRSGR